MEEIIKRISEILSSYDIEDDFRLYHGRIHQDHIDARFSNNSRTRVVRNISHSDYKSLLSLQEEETERMEIAQAYYEDYAYYS